MKKNENKILFGRRLKAERILQGIDRKEIIKHLQIVDSTLSFYETGNSYPSVEVLIKLADYLKVSTDYLLGRSEKKEL